MKRIMLLFGVVLLTSGMLLPSPAQAISSRTLIAPTGEDVNTYFGRSVASAGDVNGDGYPDVIVGATGYSSATGRAYVCFGGPGADPWVDLTLTGEGIMNFFGTSVGSAGDLNGDGYGDLIVGGPGYGSNAGRAYVYFGGPGTDTVADFTLTGAVAEDYFGVSVAPAGDVNGDGYADVIVGATGYSYYTGRAYVYYGGPGLDDIADLTLTGAAEFNYFGQYVASAGDVNGDGYGDVIVAANAFGPDGGRAYVYYGGPLADAVADLTLTGETNDIFGICVSGAGDVNGDGYGDVIVGASGHNSGTGRAYVYEGGPNADAVADLTLAGGTVGDAFGYSVASAGDVNGDGYGDVIVGSIGYKSSTGRAYVYFMGPGADAVAEVTLTGEQPDHEFGYSVASTGDVDGDGYGDVIVGADRYGGNTGRAYVTLIYPYQVLSPNGGEQWIAGRPATVRWLGHDVADLAISYDGGSSWNTLAGGVGGLEENEYALTAPSIETDYAKVRLCYSGQNVMRSTSDMSGGVFRIVKPTEPPTAAARLQIAPTGEGTNNYFGGAVASAGDVDGDGYGDVIVGAFGYSSATGRAYVYCGGPAADAVANLTLTGAAAGDRFGISASGAGDVNGDGYADVIVGASGYSSYTGRAYVYYGGPGADAVPDLTLTGQAASNYFGQPVASAGDVNGDGYGDVIVGASGYATYAGKVYVYYGGPDADDVADVTLTRGASGDRFGISVASAGDVNGDGYGDVIVGAQEYDSARGRAYVYYGGPGLGGVPDLTLTGEAAGNLFGHSVASAGDVNGDGYGDVIVGAHNADRAYVYYGGPGADAVADLTLTGEGAFGASVASAGDVNADGYGDLIVGASYGVPGRAHVYYGGPGADAVADLTLTGESGSYYGQFAASAGDVNGDGYADVIVGAYQYGSGTGRAYVYDWKRYHVTSPNGGETWNVGAMKSISWLGAEKADLWLSTDAGKHYDRIAAGVGGSESNSWSLRVPHAPGKFTMVRVEPMDASIGGFDRSDSLFTIQTSVSLLALLAAPAPDRAGAAVVSWRTDPGPEDLAGYRLEKAEGSGDWRTVMSLTRETSYTDEAAGSGGARYRLFAVNGFGEELWLGEASLQPARPLAAWPLPYRGGNLTVSFATYGGLGGGTGPAELSIFDVSGRLVRSIVRGAYAAGYQTSVWDGRDRAGRKVAAGIYFLRAQSAGQVRTLKLAVLR